jgi:hypothetical protein
MGGWDPRGGMPFRGDSNTYTIETPRSRAHIKAKASRLENNFGCLGKLVNSLGSNCYLTPLLKMPLLTGVKMAGFTHRPGFEIKIFQKKIFSTKCYPLFDLLPGVLSSKTLQCPAAVPRFYPHFGCSTRLCWLFFTKNIFGPQSIVVVPHVVRPP